jgi:hypothetical protein
MPPMLCSTAAQAASFRAADVAAAAAEALLLALAGYGRGSGGEPASSGSPDGGHSHDSPLGPKSPTLATCMMQQAVSYMYEPHTA